MVAMTSYAQRKRCPECLEQVPRRTTLCPYCKHEWPSATKSLPEDMERHALKMVFTKIKKDFDNKQAEALRAIQKQKTKLSQPQFYSFLQNGAGGTKTLNAMAEFCGVSVDALLGRKITDPVPKNVVALMHDGTADRYPERARAIQAARLAGFRSKAIRFVETLFQQGAETRPATWWLSRIVDAEDAIEQGQTPYISSEDVDAPRHLPKRHTTRSK